MGQRLVHALCVPDRYVSVLCCDRQDERVHVRHLLRVARKSRRRQRADGRGENDPELVVGGGVERGQDGGEGGAMKEDASLDSAECLGLTGALWTRGGGVG